MLRVGKLLAGILLPLNVWSMGENELLGNLKLRMRLLPEKKGALIQSFDDRKQSYIYDQALSIVAFTKAGDKENAKKLLQALKELQKKDGSLYFSYGTEGDHAYPRGGDKRIAGSIAWVGIAASHYQKRFHSKEFSKFHIKLLKYLQSQMVSFEVNGEKLKAIRFAPHDLKDTRFPENETIALEHNLDAYIAFKAEGLPASKDLLKFINAMWDSRRSHFWSGANISGAINKSELYLDNQSWSLLALDKFKKSDAIEALKLNCESLLVEHNGITGFQDSKPTRGPASDKFVWSEGTLGQILAMKKIDPDFKCGNYTRDDFLSSIKKMQAKDGGIAYATTKNADFTTSSSIAGTTWMYFALKNINPFDLD